MPLGGFLVNRRTQRRYRLDGCRRSRIQPLLKLARPFLSLLSRQQLPNTVDLRSFFPPIEEQFSSGSCVGSALASILEYFYFSTTGHMKKFSRLFIYYNARMLEDEISQRHATRSDSGADLQFAIVSLMKYGGCEDHYWPFYEHLINVQPHEQAYENSQYYRLDEIRRLSNNVNQLRECLAEGYPFVMAIKIFSSFASNHHGYIPMPKRHEKPSQYRHAVACVGYIHSARVFIIRNSHGIHWGDRGYGYLPYDYVTDKVLTKDLWAIKSIKNLVSLPIDPQLAWSDSSNLAKSSSQHDWADDRSIWDMEYSSDDNDGHSEEDEEEVREHSASPAPSTNQIPFVQPSFTTDFSPVYLPQSVVFTNPLPYHPSMFYSPPFYRPF